MFSSEMNINKIDYRVKFGIKQLIAINQISYKEDREKSLEKRFYLSQVTDLDGTLLSTIEKKQFYNQFITDNITADWLDSVLSEAEAVAKGEYSEINEQVYQELFIKIVGEVGLSIDEFNNMTLPEIDLVYRGYLMRKELDANCLLIALRKARDKKANLISLLGGNGYQYVSDIERDNILKTLDI